MYMRSCMIGCMFTVLFLLAGCQRNTTGLPELPPAEIPPLMPGTPEDSTQTVLLTLQADLRAAAAGDEATRKKALDQLRYMSAEQELMQGLNRMPQYEALLGKDLIGGFIDNWAAIVSYYAEGFHFDRMHRVFDATAHMNDKQREVRVVVPASSPGDEALIQVDCVYDEGTDRWLVMRIGFLAKDTPPAAHAAGAAPNAGDTGLQVQATAGLEDEPAAESEEDSAAETQPSDTNN